MATNPTEQILVTKSQIIPSTELKGIEGALAELDQAAAQLDQLKMFAECYGTIHTREEADSAGRIVSDVRAIKKMGAFKMNPFLDIVNRAAGFLRNLRTAHEQKCGFAETLADKIADYNRREKLATEAEERAKNDELKKQAEQKAEADRKERERIAKEQREARVKEINALLKVGSIGKREGARLLKEAGADAEAAIQQAAADEEAAKNAPPAPVRVLPNTARIAGGRARVNWKWTMKQIDLVPRQFLYPNPDTEGKYRVSDFPRITKRVGEVKDKAKLEAEIPGIEVTPEDRI